METPEYEVVKTTDGNGNETATVVMKPAPEPKAETPKK